MKHMYEKPIIEINKISVEDILIESNGFGRADANKFDWDNNEEY